VKIIKITLSLGLAIAFLLFNQTGFAQEFPKVIKIAGKAEILEKGKWTKLKTGRELWEGQSIRLVKGGEVALTSEAGKLEIIITDGSVIKYKGLVPEKKVPWGSSTRPASTSNSNSKIIPEFELLEGNANVSVEKGQPLRVITPLVIAAVRGTGFSAIVEPDGSSTIKVYDGSVMVVGRDGKSQIVNAGFSYRLTAAQYVEYLKKSKVNIPPKGWRDVPSQQLETVDSKTFKYGMPGPATHKSRPSTPRQPKNKQFKRAN
jgi:hypothetical protein